MGKEFVCSSLEPLLQKFIERFKAQALAELKAENNECREIIQTMKDLVGEHIPELATITTGGNLPSEPLEAGAITLLDKPENEDKENINQKKCLVCGAGHFNGYCSHCEFSGVND